MHRQGSAFFSVYDLQGIAFKLCGRCQVVGMKGVVEEVNEKDGLNARIHLWKVNLISDTQRQRNGESQV